MGFHNAEVSRELDTAAAYANAALRAVQRAENVMR